MNSQKRNVLIFDEQGYFYGSTQKLERLMAKILCKEFNVFYAGGPVVNKDLTLQLEHQGITVVPFSFSSKQKVEPHKLYNMQPGISDLLRKYKINCVYIAVFAHYQFPINSIPASIPLVLISPFGHYSSNGNVQLTYVSGKENAERIKKRGVKNVKLFFNPLEDFQPGTLEKPAIGEAVVFGRLGRGEDSIFDPIALKAFKKLEDIYGSGVKYIVANPPPAWKKMANDLGIKNMEFLPPLTQGPELENFYRGIDVLAHARKDGETVGMAIAEAMLAGIPILTHKSHFHNDHFDILDPAYAKWCEADDVNAYFENMKWMLEHKEQIRPMGQLARKRALEIFGLEKQAPLIIADFHKACQNYSHNTFFGRLSGRLLLYWENFKAMPFYLAKMVTYKFPGLYKFLRKFYYE